MTPSTTMPGFRMDTRPLALCHHCGHRREQSGGLLFGSGRFLCRACSLRKLAK